MTIRYGKQKKGGIHKPCICCKRIFKPNSPSNKLCEPCATFARQHRVSLRFMFDCICKRCGKEYRSKHKHSQVCKGCRKE